MTNAPLTLLKELIKKEKKTDITINNNRKWLDSPLPAKKTDLH